MLKTLNWKLTSLAPILLLTATIGCGKKMAEKSDVAPTLHTENQLPNSLLVLQLKSNVSTYPFEKFGSLNTPSELIIKEGSSTGKTVTIYYNVDQYGTWGVKCSYKGTAQGNKMPLQRCWNQDNQDLGTVSVLLNMPIYVYPGHFVQLQNPNGGVTVEAIYQVDW